MMAAPKTGAAEKLWDKGRESRSSKTSSTANSFYKSKMSSMMCHSCGGLGHKAAECNTPFKGSMLQRGRELVRASHN